MRNLAYEVVYETLEQNKHCDTVFHGIMRREKNLSQRQKSFIKRLAYGTIERCIELDAILNQFAKPRTKQMEPAIRTILRMALYEIRYMNQVPDSAACNEAVELAKKKGCGRYSGFVNGVLRQIVRNKDKVLLRDDWVKYSIPKDLMEHFVNQYGLKTARKIAASYLEDKGRVTIHIDTNKVTMDEYRELLKKQDIVFENGFYMEHALILSNVNDIAALPGYLQGYFFVQDESSMLPGICAGVHEGDVIFDVCSAPGGKALHTLCLLNHTGMVNCFDVSEYKIQRLEENLHRMQYDNVECKVWDATVTNEEYFEKADILLADVPCSGMGIIGRKPEIKYHALEQSKDLILLQRKICMASVSMLKKNGIFIYSTCTMNQKENEENVVWLEQTCGLQRESLNPYLPEILQNKMTEQGILQTLPGVQKCNGFFVARLRKKSEKTS